MENLEIETKGEKNLGINEIIRGLSENIDTTLPIENKKNEILQAINENDELIITAETGAGKSTKVPQYLANAGYNVIVTQPRILAATSLADHVAQQMNTELGDKVGYHIGGMTTNSKKISTNTIIKFCTDGLQLTKQLLEKDLRKSKKETVLIIDEVHERNQNIEVLIAWTKKLKKEGKKIKLILMSATIDSDKLVEYFSDKKEKTTTKEPPVIEVGGRTYPVESSQKASRYLIDSIVELAKNKRNVLVFQPGKSEINDTIDELKYQLGENDYIILPLHGDLSPEEQKRIYKRHHKPIIIVSTNIAQTSVTIPYIDAVVDSGKEKRILTKDGVESLVTTNISKADSKQRAGRAGRTKPGIYILCNDTQKENFDEYTTPEIQRTILDHNYIKLLASTGLKMEDLEFIHQPPQESIEIAKEKLQILGAINENGEITELGKNLAKLPIDINAGCMLIEAMKNGVAFDIAKIAAILQVGGITKRGTRIQNKTYINNNSDLITQLNLFNEGKRTKGNKLFTKEQKKIIFETLGIQEKNYYKACEIYNNLKILLKHTFNYFNDTTYTEEKNYENALLKCITAGRLDSIFVGKYGDYKDHDDNIREKGKESVVDANIVSAKSFQIKSNRYTIDIVSLISATSTEILKELAPHLIKTKENDDQKWSYQDQRVEHTKKTYYRDSLILQEESIPTTINSEYKDQGIQKFCQIFADKNISLNDNEAQYLELIYKHNTDIEEKAQDFYNRTGKGVLKLKDYYREILHNKGIFSKEELIKYLDKEGPIIFLLNDINILIPNYKKIMDKYPDTITINEKIYNITYRNGEIYIDIDVKDIDNITDIDFNQGLFEGKKPIIKVNNDDSYRGYTKTKSIDDYKATKEKEYIEKKRKEFINSKSDEENEEYELINYGELELNWDYPFTIYNEKTGSKAYKGIYNAYKYGENLFYKIKWFDNFEEAKNITQESQKIIKEFTEMKKEIEEQNKLQQELLKKAEDMIKTIYNLLNSEIPTKIEKQFENEIEYLEGIIKRYESYNEINFDNDMIETNINKIQNAINKEKEKIKNAEENPDELIKLFQQIGIKASKLK